MGGKQANGRDELRGHLLLEMVGDVALPDERLGCHRGEGTGSGGADDDVAEDEVEGVLLLIGKGSEPDDSGVVDEGVYVAEGIERGAGNYAPGAPGRERAACAQPSPRPAPVTTVLPSKRRRDMRFSSSGCAGGSELRLDGGRHSSASIRKGASGQ